MCAQWNPIETAPRDGTPILTEEGFVKYVRQRDVASAIAGEGWYLCDKYGWAHDIDGEPVEPITWRDIEGI